MPTQMRTGNGSSNPPEDATLRNCRQKNLCTGPHFRKVASHGQVAGVQLGGTAAGKAARFPFPLSHLAAHF